MKNLYQIILVVSVISYLSSGSILRAEASFNLIDGEPIRTQIQSPAVPSHSSANHSVHASKLKVQAEQ